MKIQGNMDMNSVVQLKRYGTKYFSHSTHGIKLSVVASVVGVAGLVLAIKIGKVRNFSDRFIIPWSSSSIDVTSEEFWVVPGLQNLGNNCFLNVVLQALASCSSFRRFLDMTMEEFEGSENLPLTVALASLVEELCILRHKRIALSPRKMMHAMDDYVPHFNLTCQQDAEEAFFHLLSSLKEELSECYVPDQSSLADVIALPDRRILTAESMVTRSEHERWWKSVLGPFDGILGSALTCESCSFQISLDFQLFHSLHLSPLLSGGSAIISGCSVEDCLKHFFIAEKLENYFCSHCWHIAAIKYLSVVHENQVDIQKLNHCNEEDSCDCKNLSSLGAFPWSNSWSRTFKQLHIARSPKILCFNLQRVSMNVFGEMVKRQGHISFPLVLDLTPFMSGLGIKNSEENVGNERSKQKYQPGRRRTDIFSALNNNLASEQDLATNGVDEESASCSMPVQMNGSSNHHFYRLVSVVRHYGRVGHGHYTVYRRVAAKPSYEDSAEGLLQQWFCISDSEVTSVSEEDVLNEEASLLFYEKIS